MRSDALPIPPSDCDVVAFFEQNERLLSTLQKLECERCIMDINDYHSGMKKVIELNQKLVDMAIGRQQGSKLFSSGRVVVLRDNVSLFIVGEDTR